MDRVQELERVLENILELVDIDAIEDENGEVVRVSTPFLDALIAADLVLYGNMEDDATGSY